MSTLVVTGLSGTIGKRLVNKLPSSVKVWHLYHSHRLRHRKVRHREIQVDLTDAHAVLSALEYIQPDAILHMAAITHIDRCEADKKNKKNGIVWKTNVEATTNLVKYSKSHDVYFTFLSTECVFDGTKKKYRESDAPHPINWYGTTKAAAESLVKSLDSYAIVRSVVAFHDERSGETLYGSFLKTLQAGSPIIAVNDHYFSPTHTDDIVDALIAVITSNRRGVFHVCSPELLTPYEFAQTLARHHGYDPTHVVKGASMATVLGKKRASLRLHYASLHSLKSSKVLGVTGKSVTAAVQSFSI